MKLLVGDGAPIAGGLIGAGGEIAGPQPTRPGDVLTVESEVLEVNPSRSRPDRGMVTLRSETRNQRGELAQIFTAKLVVPGAAPNWPPEAARPIRAVAARASRTQIWGKGVSPCHECLSSFLAVARRSCRGRI